MGQRKESSPPGSAEDATAKEKDRKTRGRGRQMAGDAKNRGRPRNEGRRDGVAQRDSKGQLRERAKESKAAWLEGKASAGEAFDRGGRGRQGLRLL